MRWYGYHSGFFGQIWKFTLFMWRPPQPVEEIDIMESGLVDEVPRQGEIRRSFDRLLEATDAGVHHAI